MDHISLKLGVQVGQHCYTDIDYADDFILFVDQEGKYQITLSTMDKEASKFESHVS